MTRQDINLGNYTYIIDLYKDGIDLTSQHKEQYVIIKTIKLMNDVATDDCVYFIEKSIVDECMKGGVLDTDLLNSKIAYPIITKDSVAYSANINKFNDAYDSYNLVYGDEIQEIYELQNGSYEKDIYIPCDMLRIYVPTVYNKIQALICVSNYVNGVNFYYICRPISNYSVNADNEITVGHFDYREYYDIYIPNVDNLFATDRYYMLDDININTVRQHFTDTIIEDSSVINVETIINIQPAIVNNVMKNTINFSMIVHGVEEIEFTLNSDTYKTGCKKICIKKEDIAALSKTIDDVKSDLESASYIGVWVYYDIVSTKYLYIIDVNYIYSGNDPFICPSYADIIDNDRTVHVFESNSILDSYIKQNTSFTISGCKTHSVTNEISDFLNDRTIISLSSMLLPFSIETKNNVTMKIYDNIYANGVNLHNNLPITVTLYPYESILNDTSIYLLSSEFSENSDFFVHDNTFYIITNFSFIDDMLVIDSKWKYPYPEKYSACDAYKFFNNVSYNDYLDFDYEEYSEEYETDTSIEKIGYRIEIASDNNFNNIIYKFDKSIDLENLGNNDFIDDFAFPLNKVFTSWDAMPEQLIIRTMFIDRMINNTITSNVLFISKDRFKYLINDLPIYRIHMDKNKFYFIDKINAVVSDNTTLQQNSISISSNTPRILYKPIFYKVADLQTLKIKNAITQNIGVNLSDLFTKVDTFKLVINGTEYTETSRNEIYVIFKIDASQLTQTSGSYYITNQDDEYISDGSWYIY